MMTHEAFSRMSIEIQRARDKFPKQSVWVTLAALTEEVGELNQAILRLNYEPDRGTKLSDIEKEGIQVAVMALRVICDCNVLQP